MKNQKHKKTRYSRCPKTGKTIYPDERTAGRALTMLWGNDPNTKLDDLHVYKCNEGCNGYHIGHKSYYETQLRKNGQRLPNLSGAVLQQTTG